MWFKQIQVFQLSNLSYHALQHLAENLEPLQFSPCLPSLPCSIGWVPVLDENDTPLIRMMNGYIMLCLQVEEKILPATVINQMISEKIKQIELNEVRRVRQKEKLSLKDELIITLLPRAFTKFQRIYAYIDTKNNWLILGSANAKKAEQFISLFKKSLPNAEIHPMDLKKPSSVMTYWLKSQDYPASFAVEKHGVLQDPNQENRVIRCQQQDLFANSIQTFLKEGCEVIQLALNWQDRVKFVLANDCSLRSIQFADELVMAVKEIKAETKQQQFDADFLLMTETFSGLLKELLELFAKNDNNVIPLAKEA